MAVERYRFKGVYPALVTPFDESGVNEKQYRNLIDYTLGKGATGLVPCGTTGEFTSMRFEEKVEAIRIACEAAQGRVPVVAGTGAAYTNDLIEAKANGSALLIKSGDDTTFPLLPHNRLYTEWCWQCDSALTSDCNVTAY